MSKDKLKEMIQKKRAHHDSRCVCSFQMRGYRSFFNSHTVNLLTIVTIDIDGKLSSMTST